VGAEGLRGAIAILIASTGISLAVGSANAETTAVAELEASDTADSGGHDALSAEQMAELIAEKRELQLQRQAKALANARVVLFVGIELSAEQSRGVDAIIEAEREYGRRTGELRFQLARAQKQGDTERARAIRQESGPLRARRKGRDECMSSLRRGGINGGAKRALRWKPNRGYSGRSNPHRVSSAGSRPDRDMARTVVRRDLQQRDS